MTLILSRNPDPMQHLKLGQKLRRATCAEVRCKLFMEGRTFEVTFPNGEFRIIHHPAGAECGPKCPNDICPCVNNGMIRGAEGYPHTAVDINAPMRFKADDRTTTEDEIQDRIGEGVYTIQFMRTRGL